MDRTRGALLALFVAAVAIAGVFAVGRVLTSENQTHATTKTQIARRARQLDRYEASLVKELAKRPPALPPVPAASSAGVQRAVASPIVYRRLPSIVVASGRRIDDGGERSDD